MIQNLFSLGIVYGLVAMFGWGAADFASAPLARKIGNIRGLFWGIVFTGLTFLAYLFLAGADFSLSIRAMVLAGIAGALQAGGGLSFLKGLEKGAISVVAPISAGWSVILVLAGVVFYGESLNLIQATAVICFIGGSVLVSANMRELRQKDKLVLTDPGAPYGLGAMVGWGFGWLFFNQAIKDSGWLGANLVIAVAILTTIAVVALVGRKSLAYPGRRSEWGLAIFNGATSAAAYIAYSRGIEKYLTSLIGPVAAAYPAVTVGLAQIFLKEKVSKLQNLGIAVIIAGVVLLSL